jgi:class 3 adenylate cyclase
MEPRIQYTQTADGVSIAFCVVGEGTPLLFVSPPPFCHVQLDWQATFSFLYQPLARNHRFVWFDWPGTGLSDRDAVDFSMDAMVRSIEAVVARTGLEEFALGAVASGVLLAVTYATGRPERVSHLILADGWTKFSEFEQSAVWQAEKALRDKDWFIYTETMTRVLWGLQNQEFAGQLAEYLRACVEPDAHRAAYAAIEYYDVSALLPKVAAPTLVVHNQKSLWAPLQVGQRLAARIANSRFLVVEDPTYAQLPALINEFLGEDQEAAAPTELPEGMAVLLFADIAESTALTEELGDAAFRAKARGLDMSLRSVIRESRGTPVEGKVLGDGVLAVFTSARQAIGCALRCRAASEPLGLQLHLGIHAGDVIREGNNVYGGAVNIAARIAAASEAGEVLVSDTVRSLARTSAGARFEDRGERELKGVSEPVRLYRVSGTTGGDAPCS